MATVISNIEALQTRQRAYQSVFNNPIGQLVLEDLAKFCRANQTCFHKDPRVHAALEGRREVFLRIAQHLELTTEQLLDIYKGQFIRRTEEQDTEDDPS